MPRLQQCTVIYRPTFSIISPRIHQPRGVLERRDTLFLTRPLPRQINVLYRRLGSQAENLDAAPKTFRKQESARDMNTGGQ